MRLGRRSCALHCASSRSLRCSLRARTRNLDSGATRRDWSCRSTSRGSTARDMRLCHHRDSILQTRWRIRRDNARRCSGRTRVHNRYPSRDSCWNTNPTRAKRLHNDRTSCSNAGCDASLRPYGDRCDSHCNRHRIRHMARTNRTSHSGHRIDRPCKSSSRTRKTRGIAYSHLRFHAVIDCFSTELPRFRNKRKCNRPDIVRPASFVEPTSGLEPLTCALRVRCSTS